MDETTLKIGLAGLMHDVGKFVVREVLQVSEEYLNNNLDPYCPTYKGRHTHLHGVYTAAFIEKMADYLPPELNRGGWGDGDSFINLAAMHHKPESPMQRIVTMADRLSSGLDREKLDEDETGGGSWQDYQKRRLWPILENLGADGEADHHEWRYPLSVLTPDSLFPKGKEGVETREAKQAKEEYQSLFSSFCEAVRGLEHRERVDLWAEHFDSLLMLFTANIPADRGGKVMADVSLYDHARTTSALAAALYLYHQQTGTLNDKDVQDSRPDKFLFVSGDFFGIQDFIFSTHGDTRKYRSKLLRGRSFSVSLYAELAADMICRRIGLPGTSVVINAGGKFTILAPNTEAARAAIADAEREINDWLIRKSYGLNSIGLSLLEAAPEDLKQDRFHQLWERLMKKVGARKFGRIDLDRHGGVMPFGEGGDVRLCRLCGRRPASEKAGQSEYVSKDGQEDVCDLCRDQVFLGSNLVKRRRLAILQSDQPGDGGGSGLLAPIFGRYQVLFPPEHKPVRNPELIRYWDLGYALSGGQVPTVAVKLINGYVPVFGTNDDADPRFRGVEEEVAEGDPKTFGHMAALALGFGDNEESLSGVAALGVLKADVDKLGQLMSSGLPEQRRTISRQATLSRQMDFFFSMHLPHFLRHSPEYGNFYTVFAGGDDLFLIGPWDKAIGLVKVLNDQFREYVCRNANVHFSAGVAMFKPDTPIDVMAEAAEAALEQSKDRGRHSLTVFEQTVKMTELDPLLETKKKMERWLNGEILTRGLFYRLNGLIKMAGKERRLLAAGGSFPLQEMDCTKWRSMLAYSLARNAGRKMPRENRDKIVNELNKELAGWLSNYGGMLNIPLWTLLYQIRRA